MRDLKIHIRVSEEEREVINKYAEEASTSISEFIRQCIFEKIRILESPNNEYSTSGSSQLDDYFLQNINENIEKIANSQQIIMDNTSLINKMYDIVRMSYRRGESYPSMGALTEIHKQILQIIETKKSATLNDIVEITGLDVNIAEMHIKELIDIERVKLNITTGRYSLNG